MDARRSFGPTLVTLGLAAILAAVPAIAGDWPQFRGPDRNGISAETGLMDSWPESGPKELWRQPIGDGYSAISVVGDRFYTLYAGEHEGENAEFVAAFDAASGKEVWKVHLGDRYDTQFGNGPRSTPTVVGDTVYVLSSLGRLSALATKDGSERWKVGLIEDLGSSQPYWGYSTSPVVDGSLVIVEAGGAEGKSYAALDVKTGAVKWTVGDAPAGYNSPLPIEMNGKRQFVHVAGTRLASVDAEGAMLWSQEWPQGETHAMPVFIPPNRIFASGAEGVGGALYEIAEVEGKVSVGELWKTRFMRNHFSSSVLLGEHLYGFDNATLKSLKVDDASLAWAKRGLGKGSLILADGKLIVLSDRGELLLLDATPEGYTERGRIQALEGRCWTAPTLAGGRLYLRNDTEMVAYDLTKR